MWWLGNNYAYFDQIFKVVKLPTCVEIHSVYSVALLIMSVILPLLDFAMSGNDMKKKVIMMELEVLNNKRGLMSSFRGREESRIWLSF